MAIPAGINSNGNITPQGGATVASQYVALIYIAGLLARGELMPIEAGAPEAGDINWVNYDPDSGVLEWTGTNSGAVTIDSSARPTMSAAYNATSTSQDEKLDQLLLLCTNQFAQADSYHDDIVARLDAEHLQMVDVVNSKADDVTTALEELSTGADSENLRKFMWLVNLVLSKRIDTLARLSLNAKGSKLYIQDVGAISPQPIPDQGLIDSATTHY